MLLNYEYEQRLPVAFIGAGDHAYRNILPCLQYAPVDLVALADYDRERGMAVARQFGARHFYPNYKALLSKEKVEAVFIVLGPDEQGRPRYTEVGAEAIEAGFHTWIDAPPCADKGDINHFTNACLKTRKYIVTGFKRMFAPAYLKVAEIIADPAFGGATSFVMRYPVYLPSKEEQGQPLNRLAFLQFVHPYSLLVRLFGECESFCYVRNRQTGGAMITFTYRNGLVGTLHLTAGQAMSGPLERLEVIGNGANVVVENAVRLIYYRAGGARGAEGEERSGTFIGPNDAAPIIWEPEFSLGQLYSKQIVLEGYASSVIYFAQQLLQGEPPKYGNLVDMMHIMGTLSNLLDGKEKEWLTPY
ncbi:MAG: Gfo/Idh/MocA family oxidoreductase [Chloroflexi bacterium]|nr:Gfo/Idh/MocA family oxidoreductase [Chloroflexota bacterium]